MSEPAFSPGPEWVLEHVPIADPGAGTTWSKKVPGNYEWQLVAVSSLFGTSVVVAARVPYLRLRSETRELLRVPAGAAVPGGSDVYLQWADGVGEQAGSVAEGMLLMQWPAFPLVPGYTLDWLCTNLDGGDTVEFITLTVWQRYTGRRPPDRPPSGALVTPLPLDAKMVS